MMMKMLKDCHVCMSNIPPGVSMSFFKVKVQEKPVILALPNEMMILKRQTYSPGPARTLTKCEQ